MCAEVLKYTPKYTASEAAGTPLRVKVKTLGKLSFSMHVQPMADAKILYVAFVQARICQTQGARPCVGFHRAGSERSQTLIVAHVPGVYFSWVSLSSSRPVVIVI